MALSIKTKVDKLDDLKKYVDYVKGLSKMQSDTKFQEYIKKKCLETVKRKTDELLVGGTTNDYLIQEYKIRHKIRNEINGFVLYNDFTIPYIMTTKNTKNQDREQGLVRNYENGFSIALAFEYGVGLVGEENAIQGAWEYNVNEYGDNGWFYKQLDGESVRTRGYKGFEIYRYTAEEIRNNLENWVIEYMKKERGVVND